MFTCIFALKWKDIRHAPNLTVSPSKLNIIQFQHSSSLHPFVPSFFLLFRYFVLSRNSINSHWMPVNVFDIILWFVRTWIELYVAYCDCLIEHVGWREMQCDPASIWISILALNGIEMRGIIWSSLFHILKGFLSWGENLRCISQWE